MHKYFTGSFCIDAKRSLLLKYCRYLLFKKIL